MNIMTTNEASRKWNITPRRIAMLASQGRIPGAVYVDNRWLIPANADKPSDGRRKSEKNRSTDTYVFPYLLYAISDDFPVSHLSKEEKELYDAYMQFETGEFSKGILTSNRLLKKTNNIYIRIGTYNILSYLYITQREFSQAFSSMLYCIDAYSEAGDDRPELALMINELKYYLSNHDWINNGFSVNGTAPQSDFAMAYCSLLCIIQEALQLNQNSACIHYNVHELNLLRLEKYGYDYLAMLYHFFIAIMYAANNNNLQETAHVTKAIDLAVKNNTYTSLSSFAFLLFDTVCNVLNNYSAEIQHKFKYLINLGTSAYADYIAFAGGNKLLSKIEADDYALLMYCMRGYTIQEIAKHENISLSKAKRKLGNLYDRLCVSGKKDLIETYSAVLCQPITRIAQ